MIFRRKSQEHHRFITLSSLGHFRSKRGRNREKGNTEKGRKHFISRVSKIFLTPTVAPRCLDELEKCVSNARTVRAVYLCT